MEFRSYVEAVTGSKAPRIASVGLVVDEEFKSEGDKWCSVLAMGSV